LIFYFLFSSRRRHTGFSRDWSSDVCSSDLAYTENDENDALPGCRRAEPGHFRLRQRFLDCRGGTGHGCTLARSVPEGCRPCVSTACRHGLRRLEPRPEAFQPLRVLGEDLEVSRILEIDPDPRLACLFHGRPARLQPAFHLGDGLVVPGVVLLGPGADLTQVFHRSFVNRQWAAVQVVAEV